MTTATVDPERLGHVRRARKIGRPRLARLAGMSERQIARLEGAGAASGLAMTPDVLLRLSSALQVSPGALTGDQPLELEDFRPASQLCCDGTGCCG